MILCIVDDLMFSTRIATAAKGVGAGIRFERRPDQVLPAIRDMQPALVILDLNATRLQPIAVVAGLKADPSLQHVRTLGYVSHVDSDTIMAARQAGIDQVLARSAFTERLGDILTAASRRPRPDEQHQQGEDHNRGDDHGNG
jgi:PleD family two-component response regulator